MPNGTSRALAGLFALGLACLPGATPAMTAAGVGSALPAAGPAAPGADRSPLLQPAHETLGEAVPDEQAAASLAHHMILDLVAERKIDPAWRDATPVAAEHKRLTRRSPFHVWVVRFLAAEDVGGKGVDLYIVVSDEGEFLKYAYTAP